MDGGRIELEKSHLARDTIVGDRRDGELAAGRAHLHLVTGLDAELLHLLRTKMQLLGSSQWRERRG